VTRRSDEAHVRRIRQAADDLYEACKAAVAAGLDVTLEAQGDDETKIPTVLAWVSRHYDANP
jgi:hypothetical protein